MKPIDVPKMLWGVVLADIFTYFAVSFLRSVKCGQGITYNWFGIVLSFLTIVLAIYLVFFVQL